MSIASGTVFHGGFRGSLAAATPVVLELRHEDGRAVDPGPTGRVVVHACAVLTGAAGRVEVYFGPATAPPAPTAASLVAGGPLAGPGGVAMAFSAGRYGPLGHVLILRSDTALAEVSVVVHGETART